MQMKPLFNSAFKQKQMPFNVLFIKTIKQKSILTCCTFG